MNSESGEIILELLELFPDLVALPPSVKKRRFWPVDS